MGFVQNYKETISKTVTINYDASSKGGTKTVRVDIPVEINLHFDTDPFDESVRSCEHDVNMLTQAVVATEDSEVKSKERNSSRVAGSIINGFFSYIRSEISQQVTELVQSAESKQIALKELMKRSVSLKEQMDKDFRRICGRYVKIFQDLNKELSYRIFELNKSVFTFESETNNHKVRSLNGELINIITVFGSECNSLLSKISSSVTKRRAKETIEKSKEFILQQKRFSKSVMNGLISEDRSGDLFIPVCYAETQNIKDHFERKIFVSGELMQINNTVLWNNLIERISSTGLAWDTISYESKEKIKSYFYEELERRSRATDAHSVRVRDMVRHIADFDSIKEMRNR
jgi:HD-GYP domain-containing protein (c-di-GMP phosphodiesterase class II)